MAAHGVVEARPKVVGPRGAIGSHDSDQQDKHEDKQAGPLGRRRFRHHQGGTHHTIIGRRQKSTALPERPHTNHHRCLGAEHWTTGHWARAPPSHEWTATGERAHAPSTYKTERTGPPRSPTPPPQQQQQNGRRLGKPTPGAAVAMSAYYYDYVERVYVDGRRAGPRVAAATAVRVRPRTRVRERCVCRDAPPRAATCRTKDAR
ncbi:hypothetical protein MTO96_025711 [Rhipicephalus appendiculatus]